MWLFDILCRIAIKDEIYYSWIMDRFESYLDGSLGVRSSFFTLEDFLSRMKTCFLFVKNEDLIPPQL